MQEKEIFRYSFGKLDYVAYISEYEEFIPPKGFENSVSYWLSISITKTSTKRIGRKVSRDYTRDGRFECNIENGYLILKELIRLFKNWLNKEKPEFLTVCAYEWDCPNKRMRIYRRLLEDNGYEIYIIDRSYYLSSEPIYQFCRKDLNFKRKVYKEIIH